MKVLFVNSVLYGSTGKICLDLQRELKKSGHESVICYGRKGKEQEPDNFLFNNKVGVCIDGAISRFFDNQGLNSKKQTKRLIELIKEYNPDVVHMHNLHGYYLNYPLLFDYLRTTYKRPIIWTLHDCWAFTGHCTYFDFVQCEKWKQGCHSCPQKLSYPKSICLDGSKRNYLIKKKCFSDVPNLHLVTPSLWLKRLVGCSILREYPCHVINNGIDLTAFKVKGSTERNKVVFVAGEWTEKKGGYLIKNISLKIREGYEIVIVGKWKIKKPIIKNAVFIEKRLSKNELSDIYNSAACFVNPTLEDNFPTVNIEAQSCGAPVVAFDSGGTKETLFTNGSKIVEKGDVNGIARAINDVLSTRNGIVVCDNYRFSSKRMSEDYLKLYLEVIRNG